MLLKLDLIVSSFNFLIRACARHFLLIFSCTPVKYFQNEQLKIKIRKSLCYKQVALILLIFIKENIDKEKKVKLIFIKTLYLKTHNVFFYSKNEVKNNINRY